MKTIKGVKAFNKGMTCQGFQYEEGKDYKFPEAVICQQGAHFCENPLDVLNYYDLCDSEFAEVESTGKTDRQIDDKADSKISTTHIHIKAQLSLAGFVKASVDYLLKTCTPEKTDKGDSSQLASSGDSSKLASSGDSSQLASSGDSSKLASSGDSSKLASSGDSSKLASSGDSSKLASSGYYSKLASSGYYSQLASSGDSSQLASSGYYSKLASSGDSSQLASSGYYSKLELSGQDSVAAGIGVNNTAKGITGCWLVLAEWKNNKPVCVKAEQVDGKKIKENTWYELKDGKFSEI